MFDALVVGTGPAGATTAYLLARQGLDTLIVDKRHLPRKKVCGGLITMHCAEEIRAIFDEEIPSNVHVHPPILRVRVIPPSGRKNGFYLSDYEIHNVDRSRFDHWLTSMAVKEGATFLPSHALTDFKDSGEEVTASFDTDEGRTTIETRYLIGADGVYSKCRQELFGEASQSTMSILQEYYREMGLLDDAFYLFFRGDVSPMYAYLEPKDGYAIMGLGVQRDLGPSAKDGLERFRLWLRRDYGFEPAGYLGREGWSIPLGDVAYGKGRAVLVGDAGGFCEPLTGEGIYYAVMSARAAAAAVSIAERNGGNLAELYRESASPLGEKMREVTARVKSLTDEERETALKSKMGRLRDELLVTTPA